MSSSSNGPSGRRIRHTTGRAASLVASRRLRYVLIALGVACLAIPFSEVLGLLGTTDHSLPRVPIFGDLPEGLAETHEGAFEGGPTGTPADAAIEAPIPENELIPELEVEPFFGLTP